MRKCVSILVFLFLISTLHAQYSVRFVLKEKTAIPHDSIYVSGSFNNWDSKADKKYLLRPTRDNKKSIVLNLPEGIIRYKFHRGNWNKVEKQYNGEEVPDRIVNITKETVFVDSVASWRDQVILDKMYALLQEKEDTSRVNILTGIANNYAFFPEFYNSDSALFYANEALLLQQKIIKSGKYKSSTGEGPSNILIGLQDVIATLFHSLGNYRKSLELRLENLALSERQKDRFLMAHTIRDITKDYNSMNDYENMLRYGKLLDSVANTMDAKDERSIFAKTWAKYAIASAFFNLDQVDSALYYANVSFAAETPQNQQADTAFRSLLLGNIYAKKGDDKAAFYHYRLVSKYAFLIHNPQLEAGANEGLARLFKKQGRIDSALYYAKKAMVILQTSKSAIQTWGENSDTYVAKISPLIAELYKASGQPDSAYKFLQLSVTLKDSLYNTDKVRQFQTLSFNETARRQQLEQQSREAQQQYQTRIKIYGLIGIITVFVVLAFILYRNNKHKQKANILLQKQKQEIETTLGVLKNTQKQLIQSEKMASLGELTAGIAHEIQNPLNFVNNFSDVNKELIDEMNGQLAMGNMQEVKEIAGDIRENEEKINHHGKRADAIVKNMLLHSKAGTGQKEATDINALADEYLRLAYHGIRAKDKSFNANLETDFDQELKKIEVVPQDIGRVLLNLINNAFFAVDDRRRAASANYEPTVKISSREAGNNVEISITDNGTGMSDKVKEKIFQPFFTTKATGQGTGLGLSLSYDIVKAHGGEIKVETEEGKGSSFTVQLPAIA